MKAPEKIYVTPVRTWDTKHIPDLQDNIYISKDALLEWAKEHYTSLDITKRDMWDGGYNCAIKELIDKLNEM